jgi:hypothetical protein
MLSFKFESFCPYAIENIPEATHHIPSVEKHPISGIKKELLIKSVHSRHSQNFRDLLLSQH